jgi:hypothetical protein
VPRGKALFALMLWSCQRACLEGLVPSKNIICYHILNTTIQCKSLAPMHPLVCFQIFLCDIPYHHDCISLCFGA